MTIAEKKIMNLLKESGFTYELYEHEPVYTCEQAAKVRGIRIEEGIKCLLLKCSTGFVLVLTRGDKRLDLKKIASLENSKNVRLANDKEIEKIAECPKGCVHPFCNVKTYVDKILLENKTIDFNPGCHDKSIRMNVSDMIKLIKNPIIQGISVV